MESLFSIPKHNSPDNVMLCYKYLVKRLPLSKWELVQGIFLFKTEIVASTLGLFTFFVCRHHNCGLPPVEICAN